MAVVNEIEALVRASTENSASFDPVHFLKTVSDRLAWACSPGQEYDSLGPNFLDGQGGYFIAVDFLTQNGFVAAAEQLLFEWWHNIGVRQLTETQHIYRAGTAYKLAQLYLRKGDMGGACRWALLTQAADILREHPEGGGAGKQWLRTVIGANNSELDVFDRLAFKSLGVVKSGDENAPSPPGIQKMSSPASR